ncbi:DUF2244 domain-containing protein [Sinimarinibacterium sp. CAU 1509]|uniref:DUF2244 domain-containing protein n=1 Tax=Sinimarinibacterium sp. CAU 1509 TaxID=2562283 RepID=UPI0010AD9A11|nr:DUF2244 domain-containing protein [Sinimarinibacterium sp. CAU 1509]TJY58954.1 DUF2244 domain-containing protein [Sinimarinibacterium sp. CAU 1509]
MLYNLQAVILPPDLPEDVRLVIGPNASLGARQAWTFMGMTVALGGGIAAWMAWHGFWLVVPFTGLELAALGAAIFVSVRRNTYREVLVFAPECLRVEFGSLGRGAQTVVELSRGMTRALLEAGANRHEPTRLILSCAGQRVRIARCLTDEERERLCVRIKQLLTPAWGGSRSAIDAAPVKEWPLGD